MPLGAITAAPASAWLTACFTRRATVSSFLTVDRSGVSGPQWPWSVYSQKHKSLTGAMGRPAAWVARNSRQTTLSGFSASDPIASFSERSTTPKAR